MINNDLAIYNTKINKIGIIKKFDSEVVNISNDAQQHSLHTIVPGIIGTFIAISTITCWLSAETEYYVALGDFSYERNYTGNKSGEHNLCISAIFTSATITTPFTITVAHSDINGNRSFKATTRIIQIS